MNKSRIYFALLCSLVLSVVSVGSAWALTASNTQIINNASLTYNDGTGNKTVNALPVVVTVSLIPGTPTVAKGPDMTTQYAGVDTTLVNTFTVTASNTNGPDNYSLTPAINTVTNATGASVLLTSPASPVRLGATVTLSGCTKTSLLVPSDGVSGAAVNGIANGATIVVGGTDIATVNTVTNTGSGTATITLVGTGLAAAPGAGILVAEQKTVTVTLKSGTITTTGADIIITKHLTIASTTDAAKTATSADITDTYTSGLATLTKYVRNVTAVPTMTGTGTKTTYKGIDYWPSGITAKPSETLEYILVATNTGTGSVSAAAINDSLPVTYVSLKTAVYTGGKDITYFDETGTASYLTSAAGDDAATYASPTLTVNVGTGANSAAGGTIASGATVRVLYQVTVNP